MRLHGGPAECGVLLRRGDLDEAVRLVADVHVAEDFALQLHGRLALVELPQRVGRLLGLGLARLVALRIRWDPCARDRDSRASRASRTSRSASPSRVRHRPRAPLGLDLGLRLLLRSLGLAFSSSSFAMAARCRTSATVLRPAVPSASAQRHRPGELAGEGATQNARRPPAIARLRMTRFFTSISDVDL